jgi:hypothetical protein
MVGGIMANSNRSFWSTPNGWAALGLMGAVSYFLLVEHREHVFALLPFIILMACPLMHLLMHKNHHTSVNDKEVGQGDPFEKAYQKGFIAGKNDHLKDKQNEDSTSSS